MTTTESENIFDGLNPAQRDAVSCTEGASIIVAGAGSGKTRVLTCRIANILAKGAEPSQVIALTFTKKAAGEMKERIASLVGASKARWIWMGTFHSIFIRFLREYATELGYPQQFTIYDSSDSRSAIKQCIKELSLDEKDYKPAFAASRISLAKNNLKTVAGYRNDNELMAEDREHHRSRICDIYALYSQKCKAAGAMDFDDILLNMNILLRDFPQAKSAIQERFNYIMVDEYQDTNYAQYLILKKLAEKHHNLCVVGDDSQSIYGFRGARIENILRFKKDYPEAKEFRLEQNYRSTQTIVAAANSLISKNEHRLKKECYSKAESGDKIGVIKAFTEQEEAYLIASSIVEKIYATKSTYNSFAILYRTNAQSRALEEQLRRKNLPYRIYGGHSFFERAEIKDMLAYFKLIVNNKDDEALKRIINVPARGIGDTTMERLITLSAQKGISLFEGIELDTEELKSTGMKEATIKRLKEFTTMIAELSTKSMTEDAYTLAIEAGNVTGYLMSLKNDNSPEGEAKFDNVEELFNGISEFVEEESQMRKDLADEQHEEAELVVLTDYLENVYLLSEAEKDDLSEDDDVNNKITLMTVHASKGLEFPFVYIAGMEENLFPSSSMNDTIEKIEEERRLFYVALTRAEKCVTVSFAKNRMKWGQQEKNSVSRFVKEIDSRYLESPVDDGELPFTPHKKEEFLTTHNNGDYYSRSHTGQSGRSNGIGYLEASKPLYIKGSSTPQQRRQTSLMPQQNRSTYSITTGHAPDPSFRADPVSSLREGMRVEHDRFGFGVIRSFDGVGANIKAVVTFDESGDKTLLMKFAKIRIVHEE